MITVHYHPAASGRRIGEAILTNPTALNALSPPDAIALVQIISEWRTDDSVAAVVLRGDGERAFCAGGDVRSVHAYIAEGNMDEIDAYFADEYRANYALHCFNKPLVAFAHGIVMGGGMGLMQGCNIRIVTPQTKMAMPEHKIGFFPDVGAAFFTKRFCGAPQIGYYIGLSGRIFKGDEALALRAADVMASADDYGALLAAMQKADWHGNTEEDMQTANHICNQLGTDIAPDNATTAHPSFINKMYEDALSGDVQLSISRMPKEERAVAAIGSPLSHKVWTEYYCRRHAALAEDENLRQTFMLDYTLAMNFTRRGDFGEGVRALLIDKDNRPQWQAPHDDAAVAAMFESPAPEKSRAFWQSLADIA